MSKVIVCDCCKKTFANWHYDNPFNSSKFCNICGSYCSTYYDLDEDNIKRFEEEHEKWIINQRRTSL